MSELDSIIIETQDQPDSAVIWLHGLGADGNDFVPVIDQLHLPSNLAIRFIFPHAPIRPITINQGYQMPGWYDISSLAIAEHEDTVGINESSIILKRLCEEQEANGITTGRIVLAGFSQGGAIALHCGCRYPKALAGILALSTYLPLPDTLTSEVNDHSVNTPVFMAHGTHDEVVAFQYGKQSRTVLQANNFIVDWHEYNMGHSVCMEEISDIRQWLTDIL